jgi:hypothetical protein
MLSVFRNEWEFLAEGIRRISVEKQPERTSPEEQRK